MLRHVTLNFCPFLQDSFKMFHMVQDVSSPDLWIHRVNPGSSAVGLVVRGVAMKGAVTSLRSCQDQRAFS